MSDSGLPITPLSRPVDATIELPGSKSYTNRALLIAALADGQSTLTRALFSDDTEAMHGALEALGISVHANAAEESFVVQGKGGLLKPGGATLDVRGAGTAARFLTAAVALGQGDFVVDGNAQMRKRPIEPLVDALRQLGMDAQAQLDNGCPPVLVRANGLPGGTARVRGDISSQYFSALMLVAPYAQSDVRIEVEGELVSAPYVEMTAGIMADFGVEVSLHDRDLEVAAKRAAMGRFHDDDSPREYGSFTIASGQRYRARDYAVEPDASAASYFFAAAAVTGGRVRIQHLGSNSLQGDLGLLQALAMMGCNVTKGSDFTEVQGPEQLRGARINFSRMGDVASTLAAIAPFASSPVTIEGIAQTHYEESDRPVATATELRRMGIQVDDTWDSLTIHPGVPQPALVETYNDHRMAMSFAVTGLKAPGISIANPRCVDKTFPNFFEVLDRLR